MIAPIIPIPTRPCSAKPIRISGIRNSESGSTGSGAVAWRRRKSTKTSTVAAARPSSCGEVQP